MGNKLSQLAGSPLLQRIELCAIVAILAITVTSARVAKAEGHSALPAVQASATLIALGKQLFSDPRLSSDGLISCASCHIPAKDFADGRRVAIGVEGKAGTRNTPSLASVGRSARSTFFWDGRRTRLEQAVLDPFTNPVEMGLHNDDVLMGRLRHIPAYRDRFKQAFVDETPPLQDAEIAQALSAYIRSIDHRPSAYDRYASGKNPASLSLQARMGLAVFAGKGRCAQCHLLEGTPPALTDEAFHHTGVGFSEVQQRLPQLTRDAIERSLQGADLGNRIATHTDEAQLGRFNVTHHVADIGMFRTPSLRGVAATAPYMHDGSVRTLAEAVDREVYYRSLSSGHPISLTTEERIDLVVFLQAL